MRVTVTLEETRGGGVAAPLPFDSKAAFGKVRAPVVVTLGVTTFRTTTMRYGGIDYLGFNREVRAAAGVVAGETVEIGLEPDLAPREVDLPDELEAALGRDPDARARFDALAYTHRREYATWVAEAKRDETRSRRAEQAVARLRASSD
jgi:hypothetical protein